MPLDAPVTIAARSAIRPSKVSLSQVARNPTTPAYTPAVRRTALPLALLALAVAGAGCGEADHAAAPPEPEPTAHRADFPAAAGRTAGELEAGAARGPILAPSVSVVVQGRNRFAFALF